MGKAFCIFLKFQLKKNGQPRVDWNLVGNGEMAPQILHGAASVLAQNALKSSIQAFLHSSILAAKMFSLLIALADVYALSDKHWLAEVSSASL